MYVHAGPGGGSSASAWWAADEVWRQAQDTCEFHDSSGASEEVLMTVRDEGSHWPDVAADDNFAALQEWMNARF